MAPKVRKAKAEVEVKAPEATQMKEGTSGTPGKAGGRRREREPEAQNVGQGRTTRRKRGPETDTLHSADSGGVAAEVPNTIADLDNLDEADNPKEVFLDAVVKVFCVHSEPNYSLPWQRKRQYSTTSSGFIISGRRILTNAHSVDHHCQVKVRRRGSDTKFIAKVLSQGPECDIALLSVEDEAFWESNIAPVQFGTLPRLQDSVSVVGFPIGGDTMSVTSGVVSRIEVTSYSHGATALLGMQIDAAINPGNSGGPAFNSKGECVGIAFQTLKSEDAENIGYVIPVDVVLHFITDFERNGKFTGFPILGIEWQKMESPYMRKAMGMKEGQKGVLVRGVEPTSPASKHIKKWDILLSFDGTQLANDGTVQFRSGERINFSYLVSKKYTNDLADVEILRGGKSSQTQLQLSQYKRLIPEHLSNRPPSYLIISGFVFTQVSTPYLRSEYGQNYDYDSPVKLLDLLLHGKAKRTDQQVVVLGHVLAAECTQGYEDLQNYQVFSVNSKKINNLADLVGIVDACHSEYLRFELEYEAVVIIDTKVAKASTKDIMAMHLVEHDRSLELREPDASVEASKD